MDKFSCRICFKEFNGKIPLKDHLASPKHIKRVEDFNASEWDRDPFIIHVGLCTLCRMPLNSLDQLKNHIRGGIHIKAKSSIRPPKLEKEKLEILNQCVDNFPSTSANIPDPQIEINEYIDEVEKLLENIKVLISKL